MPVDVEGLRINGDNTVVSVFLDGRQIGVAQTLKSWSVEPKVVEHDDSLIGQTEDKPDQQIRGWTFKLEQFVVDATLSNALLAREEKRRTRRRYESITIGLVLRKRDGTNQGYSLTNCEIPPSGFNAQGAAERVMQSFSGRAEKFNPVTL